MACLDECELSFDAEPPPAPPEQERPDAPGAFRILEFIQAIGFTLGVLEGARGMVSRDNSRSAIDDSLARLNAIFEWLKDYPNWSRAIPSARVAELEGENKRLRGALSKIAALDYTRAATNCCAIEAHQIALSALKQGETK